MRPLALVALATSLVLAGCGFAALPSVQLRSGPEPVDDGVRVSISTDRFSQAEAQDILMLSSAAVARRSGAAFFQFRSVKAEGLTEPGGLAIRYFDIEAVIDPLSSDEAGDPARKTYDAARLIETFGPRYMPVLPGELRPAS
ncbi:MAG: hypothetical protein ACMVY4_08530 [Minwuia sp.]|uniref:hypothetical protein n=1 Tax=Minwuia sp. TaxID=2493630 RepID=UPI003A889CD3